MKLISEELLPEYERIDYVDLDDHIIDLTTLSKDSLIRWLQAYHEALKSIENEFKEIKNIKQRTK